MKNFEVAKKICKEHGVKGFRKLKLKRVIYTAGKQTVRVKGEIAIRLINRLEASGYIVGQRQTMIELAEKGLSDTFSIS